MDISQLKITESHELIKSDIPEELDQLFFSDKIFIPVSHLGANPPDAQLNRQLDLSKRMKYHRRPLEWKHSLHWGQLKLHLSEIEFLTIIMQEYNKAGDKRPITFVYVGAAPGQHNDALMDMFKDISFELYDPNPFAIKPNSRRKIFQRFFVDQDAKQLAKRKDEYIVFCSDIRTEPASEENVQENMDLQLRWWKLINPEWAMFKFRLKYAKFSGNKPIYTKTNYPNGQIYTQPFVGPTSTETRLIVKKNAPLIDYDDHAYEEACFYHQSISRTSKYTIELPGLDRQPTIPTQGFDQCFDCASMLHILKEWGQLTGTRIDVGFVNKFVGDVHPAAPQSALRLTPHDLQVHPGKTMYSKTIEYTREMLSHIRRRLFQPCGNMACKLCENQQYQMTKGKSKATNEAFNQANHKLKSKAYRLKK